MSVVEFALSASEVAVILGFSVGFLYGEAFSKFDQAIKYKSAWFKTQKPLAQWFVSSLLDANHHFQAGLVIVLSVLSLPFYGDHPTLKLIGLWLGWGLVASDLRDFKNILRRLGLMQSGNTTSIPTSVSS